MVVLAHAKTNTLKSVALRPGPDLIRGQARLRITVRLSDRVVQLYASGMSTRAIALELSISKTAVLSVLKAAAVPLRPRGGARPKDLT